MNEIGRSDWEEETFEVLKEKSCPATGGATIVIIIVILILIMVMVLVLVLLYKRKMFCFSGLVMYLLFSLLRFVQYCKD